MRSTLAIVLLTSSTLLHAQTFERVEVVEVDTIRSAREIYSVAERWFVDAFRDAEEVIQLRDTSTYSIVGKGSKVTPFVSGKGMSAITGQAVMRYTVEVQAKKGRYRAKVYDVTVNGVYSGGPYTADTCCLGPCTSVAGLKGAEKTVAQILDDQRKSICPQTVAEINALFASLKAAMLKPTEDW